SIGSTRLWAGRSPGVLRRLLQRAELRWDVETAGVLLWAIWGGIAPSSLRFCLRAMVRARDHAISGRFADGRPHEWRIPCADRDSPVQPAGCGARPALASAPDRAA